jgi:AhpD family alkylhydroperoxidase
MSEGEIPYLYKEMIYVAVSIANNCNYCIHSHTYTAKKAGMTDVQYKELLSVILMANKTNALATALGTQVDDVLDTSKEGELRK